MSRELPAIEWPEAYGPNDGAEIADAILTAFRERCAFELDASGVRLLLVPDPPQSSKPLPWILDHLPAHADVTSLNWGARGIAYIVRTPTAFADCIRVLLATHSTTLSIVFVQVLDGSALLPTVAAPLIESFLSGSASAQSGLICAGMFFDMGVLRSFECC